MIDLKLLEKNFDDIAKRLKLKGVDESSLEEIKNLFKEKKELKTSLDIFKTMIANGKINKIKVKKSFDITKMGF